MPTSLQGRRRSRLSQVSPRNSKRKDRCSESWCLPDGCSYLRNGLQLRLLPGNNILHRLRPLLARSRRRGGAEAEEEEEVEKEEEEGEEKRKKQKLKIFRTKQIVT